MTADSALPAVGAIPDLTPLAHNVLLIQVLTRDPECVGESCSSRHPERGCRRHPSRAGQVGMLGWCAQRVVVEMVHVETLTVTAP